MLAMAFIMAMLGFASAFQAAPRAMPMEAVRSLARLPPASMAGLAEGEYVPDMQRRTIMNLLLLGSSAVPVAWMGGGFVLMLIPPKSGGKGGGVMALDANGDQVKATSWAEVRHASPLCSSPHFLFSTLPLLPTRTGPSVSGTITR